jgi:hypothetical protein
MSTSRLYFGCSSTDPENEFKVSPVLCRAPNSLGSLNADDGEAIRIFTEPSAGKLQLYLRGNRKAASVVSNIMVIANFFRNQEPWIDANF